MSDVEETKPEALSLETATAGGLWVVFAFFFFLSIANAQR